MIEDVIEGKPSLEHRIKNLETFTNTLKEEVAEMKKAKDEIFLEILKLRDEIFE